MIIDKSLQRITLLLVGLAAFLIPFMGSSLNLALPLIQRDLMVNIILLGWIPTAFVLANAAFVLPFGRLADIYGRRKIFTYGVFIYTLASFFAAISISGEMLIFFSFLQGLGCSMLFATMVALLSSVFPMERRGEALGLYVTAVYIGLFMGPLLGGLLIQYLGWRSIFLFNIPIGLILISILFWKFKMEWAESSGDKFDLKVAAIYIVSIAAILYGFSSVLDNLGRIILLAGILGISLFIFVDNRSDSPLISLSIFKNSKSSFTALSMLLLNTAISAIPTFLSLYLQFLRGFQPYYAAIILAVQPLMVALLSPTVGRAADRMDNRFLPVIGLVLITLGLLVLSILKQNTPLVIPILALLIIGAGQAMFSSPTTRTFMGSVQSKIYGAASSVFSTTIYLGQTLSLGILILVFTLYLGKVNVNPSNYTIFLESLQTAFLIFTIISGLSVLSSLLVGKTNRTN